MSVKGWERKGRYRCPTLGLIVLLFSPSMAIPAFGGQFEDSVAAMERGDYGEAYRLTRPLAEQGNAKAQFNLGIMYYIGQGIMQDYILAHMWLNLAASRFPESEAEKREMSAKSRDLVASKMTLKQIAEAQRLAREWKPEKEGTSANRSD